jgi:hypothetical protein
METLKEIKIIWRYLRKYNEGVGDDLPDNDEFLILMNDLSLSVSDIGFDVEVVGIESFKII